MSYLDNLENNLKSLESHGEGKDDQAREQKARETARSQAQAAAAQVETLKKGPYTAELMRQAARVGHALRTKVNMAWIGSTLRLEARERRLELRPTASGIVAVYLENNQEKRSEPLDLGGSPEALLRGWLGTPPESGEKAG